MRVPFHLTVILLCMTVALYAREKKSLPESLASYLQRMQQIAPAVTSGTPGSLWVDNGSFATTAVDYKAAHVGDLITIVVVQDVTAQNSGNISTARTFSANSGISALPAGIKTTKVQSLFSPNSAETLSGKTSAATTSTLRTQLTGRVVAVLPTGQMVVEAEREITMNNERQTVLVRGLVRPGDISPANSVLSNNVGNLELELKGKGVLSDGTRPPNLLVRLMLKLVGF
jgi:flagellar L-ring protein precursor FlgH